MPGLKQTSLESHGPTKHLLLLVMFFLLALLAYSSILNSFFLSDDFDQIGKVLGGDWSFTWGLGHGGFFRPLFILSYVLDSTFWGTNPFGYHLTNVVLHALNSYLVFVLSAQLMRRNNQEPEISFRVSAVAGLLFLLLPSHTEAVSWISGRADLIATLFFLMALILYCSYKQNRRSLYLVATLACFLLALLAKESALCLPFILIALELLPANSRREVDFKQVIKLGALLAVTVGVYWIIRYAALGVVVGGYGASRHLDFKLALLWERLPKFSVRAVLPPLPEQLSFILFKPFKSKTFIAFCVVFVAAVTTLLAFRRKRQPPVKRRQQNAMLFLLLLLFLCSLLPVITMGINVFDTLGERFVYLPSVFTSIALAYASASFIPNRRWWLVAISCILIFYSAGLYRSNQRWREAAGLSKSILNDLALSRQDALLVMNVPDTLRGVPVYHNGLEQALKTFQPSKKISQVDIVSFQSLRSTTDMIEIRREANVFSIRLLDERAEFSRVNDHMECVLVEGRSKNSIRIRLRDCITGKEVFVFQKGRMSEVSTVQS